jgi:diguanylate cyclase (GGDEF)-like protein/PAS domain S-box-containing protein
MQSRWSTTLRLSLGLVSLTISLLLVSELLGLMPDKTEAKLEVRKKVVELIAVQIASAATNNDLRIVQTILDSAVERDESVQSAAVRRGVVIVAVAGDHDTYWKPPSDGRSTPTHVQVPIRRAAGEWGVLELAMKPFLDVRSVASWKDSQFALLGFIGLAGFGFYFLFLRRALKELDPSSVVPDHVKAAFDALAEGVIILDEDERIVLANKAFAALMEMPASELTGRKASALEWQAPESTQHTFWFPWQKAMSDARAQTGVPMRRTTPAGETRVYVVNGAPILDGGGKVRGALATFDDVSDLEKKNEELEDAMTHLASSKEKVKRQNKELRFLATRDPLTGLLNRRALFERFNRLFENARKREQPLCCIMADIDHFKSINDRYGHAAGDKVIKFVGKELKGVGRTEDLPARYGGEEFCLVVPGADLDTAAGIAERLRLSISENFDESFSSSIKLTISLGVALMEQQGEDSPADLLNRADKALYAAKKQGRNRVMKWGDPEIDPTDEVPGLEEIPPASTGTMLVPKFDENAQTLQLAALSNRVVELDAMIEEKTSDLHRKHGFDQLTGLPNRILFYDRLTQALSGAQRDSCIVAVMYVDVDLLQRDESNLGPVSEEDLLCIVSERLSSILRSTDSVTLMGDDEDSVTVSRLGGNEFGIALNSLSNTELVIWIIQRLFGALSTPITIEKEEVYANCSIGVSLYPSDGEDAETLVRCASVARHHAHTAMGHNQFRFFSDNMNERSFQQVQMQSQLRDALELEQFDLYMQPEIDMKTGRCVAMEALIRWAHPEMGLIGPDMFIPLAEQTGLIVEIGDWVLRTACTQMKEWVDSGFDDMRVSVNLSPVQLESEELVDQVLQMLESIGLEPKHLELEITETALMENLAEVEQAIQKLRAAGVKIAIDDFGTGYSSLSHLKRLVVDCLKIDRSFVKDVATESTDAALVAAVVAMAKSMGLRVVAEGIETEVQLAYLSQLECDVAQGFLLSHPLPLEDADALLRTKTNLLPDIDGTRQGLTTAQVLSKGHKEEARERELAEAAAGDE